MDICLQAEEMSHDWPKLTGVFSSYVMGYWYCWRCMIQLLSRRYKGTFAWILLLKIFWYNEGFIRRELCPLLFALDMSQEDGVVSPGVTILLT